MKCFLLPSIARTVTPSCMTAIVLLCSGLSFNTVIAAEKPKTAVADLRYGVALYNYYQQDYLQALSELMVADARDGIHGHGDNPMLVNGGISLAFGMQDHAEKLFTQVLQDKNRLQPIRDAAWFYLGKLQYARSDWPAAEQSFSRVSDNFNPHLLAEMRSLQINLLIKKNDFSQVSVKKVHRDDLGSWTAFTLYNLFAAHARNGDMATAQEFLRDLEKLSLDDNKKNRREYYALLDKTYTAFGYGLLQEKKYNKAIDEFNKVSLDGLESNQALLGYGWAAMEQGKYLDAIKAWQVLQKRSLLYIPAQEALVALPFAYEKLNAPGDALHEYQNAEQLLGQEINLVQDMRATLTLAELLELVGSKPVSAKEQLKAADKSFSVSTLSAQVVDDGQNWLKINNTSILKTRSMYLHELFMRNDFQTEVLDLRDLLKLQKMLQAWQPKLIAYAELLQQKQLLRQQQDTKIAQQSLNQKQRELQSQRDRLLARLTVIKDNDDYIALADDQIRTTYGTIERSQATIRQLKAAGQDTSAYENRLQILRGILLWRGAQQFPGVITDNEVAIDKIDKALAEIAASDKKITAITETGFDLQPKLLRIQQQQKQLQEQLQQINAAINIRGEQLHQKVDKQLESHEKRLDRYLAQSHLAVARLYDTALRNQPQ